MTQNTRKTKIEIPWNWGYLCKLNLLVEDETPQNAILIQVNIKTYIKAFKSLTNKKFKTLNVPWKDTLSNGCGQHENDEKKKKYIDAKAEKQLKGNA